MAAPRDDGVHLMVDPEECDLGNAEYDIELSSAAGDANQNIVYTTIDRVVFRPIPDVVETVLDANGFALNLENVLASLDEVRIGYRVRGERAANPSARPVTGRGFLPALTTRLPAKHRIGPLLTKFYAEIDAYRAQLAELSEAKGRIGGQARREVERLEKERDELSKQNELLQAQLLELTAQVAQLRRSYEEAHKALTAQNVLPAQVRLAEVQEVDLETRHVALKAGRKVFSIPLVALWIFPEKDDRCLVSLQDGHVVGVFFHEGKQTPPGMVLAQVLHVVDDQCKIREENRRTRIIKAKNPAERELLRGMRRGDRLVLFLHENELIRFSPCGPLDAEAFVRAVQESIARWDIRRGEVRDIDGPGTSQ